MRPADFDLATALARKGFTPAQRDAPALVALIARGDEPAATRAAPALAGLGGDARAAIVAAVGADGGSIDDGAHARLVAVLGLLARAGDDDARALLIAQLGDGARTSRVRRAAAVALGKLGTDDARAALLARWDAGDATPDERRALAEALGKVGGAGARGRLAALDSGGDAELARRRDRALLMTDRAARRDEASEVRADVAPPAPVIVRLHCRAGMAALLRAELDALGMRPTARGDAGVDVTLAGPWSQLFAARLWATAGVRVPLARGEDLTAAIARTITAPDIRALLATWTRGPIRWRIGFQHGHRRAVVWTLARDVAALAPELINDPHATTWDIAVDEAAGVLELAPRRLVDPRFAWRVAEVPAASHPTVAAALAWVAEPRAGERVWDPFTGSGAELIECARRAAVGALLGSDLSTDALAAATANLAAAGVTAALALADARTHAPGPVDVIVTNPPLGGRLRGDAGAMLGAALPNLAAQLARSGRLVWITPAPRRTGPIAVATGLTLAHASAVDLGGMRGQLERWDRR